jgi:acyl carrier protein
MDKELNDVFAKVLKIAPGDVQDAMRLGEVATWDSLSHMDLILSIEEAFGIQFTGDEIADMTQIAAIRALVKAKAGI